MRIVYGACDMTVCMWYARLGMVLGRHPKINLFGLLYSVICCEVETKFGSFRSGTGKLCILGNLRLVFIWSCFVSCLLLFLLFYASLRNMCSGTHFLVSRDQSWE